MHNVHTMPGTRLGSPSFKGFSSSVSSRTHGNSHSPTNGLATTLLGRLQPQKRALWTPASSPQAQGSEPGSLEPGNFCYFVRPLLAGSPAAGVGAWKPVLGLGCGFH